MTIKNLQIRKIAGERLNLLTVNPTVSLVIIHRYIQTHIRTNGRKIIIYRNRFASKKMEKMDRKIREAYNITSALSYKGKCIV